MMFTIKQKRSSLVNLRSQISNKKSTPIPIPTFSTKFQDQQQSPSTFPKIKFTPNILDEKKKKKYQAKQLSLAIEGFNLRKKQNNKSPKDSFIFDILTVLKQFSLVQNNFQALFLDMYMEIQKFLFLDYDVQLATKYQIKEGQLFKKACKIIDKKVTNQLKTNRDKISSLHSTIQQKNAQYKTLSDAFTKRQAFLTDQISRLKVVSNTDYVQSIEEKLQKAKQRIFDLSGSQNDLINLRGILQRQIQQLMNNEKAKMQQISKLNAKIYDLNIMRSKNQAVIIKIRDRFDQLNMKLLGIRQTIESVQEENQQLKTQRIKLLRRAAVSFEQLTPRPKYSKAFQFSSAQVILNPTADIVDTLFQQVFCSSTLSKQAFFKKHLKQRQVGKNQKLMDMQKIRQKIGDDIIQSKKDLQTILNIVRND